MFPWSKPSSPAVTPSSMMVAKCDSKKPLFLTAARIDTDHTVGCGSVALTGKYDSKKDSFGIDFAYAIDDANTVHATYAVTDEKITSIGIESGKAFSEKYRTTVDATYKPPSDSGLLKVGVRQGKVKLNSYFSFAGVSSSLNNPCIKLELDSKFSSTESIKLGYDVNSKNAKIKYGKKLDAKNKFDAEYVHVHDNPKCFLVKLSHNHSKKHSFSAGLNYGAKKIATEWEWNTDNGPWTVNANIPFNASPSSGDWSIKRRFEL